MIPQIRGSCLAAHPLKPPSIRAPGRKTSTRMLAQYHAVNIRRVRARTNAETEVGWFPEVTRILKASRPCSTKIKAMAGSTTVARLNRTTFSIEKNPVRLFRNRDHLLSRLEVV